MKTLYLFPLLILVFIFTQPDFHCLHPHRGHGQNLNAWSLLQQSPVTWTLTLVMFGRWKMSKRTKGAQLYNCNCPKIWYHENWNNHVPAISQLCPYHKSQLVNLCSQSAWLPDRLCKASELNLKIKRSRVLTSEATARQSPVKGFEITPPGGGLEERRK